METELIPRYDSRQSFYNKARVRTNSDGAYWLMSYDTHVASIHGDTAKVYGTYSQTTLRHIKEFLKQHGFRAETSKQIMEDYGSEK